VGNSERRIVGAVGVAGLEGGDGQHQWHFPIGLNGRSGMIECDGRVLIAFGTEGEDILSLQLSLAVSIACARAPSKSRIGDNRSTVFRSHHRSHCGTRDILTAFGSCRVTWSAISNAI
jgi:hypothetical protein